MRTGEAKPLDVPNYGASSFWLNETAPDIILTLSVL